jgi:hypothetical protein
MPQSDADLIALSHCRCLVASNEQQSLPTSLRQLKLSIKKSLNS